ncbi:MAG: VOC family protein [Thermoplasmata archaeon]
MVRDARALVRLLEQALDGKVTFEEPNPTGRVSHVEVRIADRLVMIADTPLGGTPFPAMVHLYVLDADAAYRRALSAGATSVREPADQPDGDRRGGVQDPGGNEWWFTRTPEGS